MLERFYSFLKMTFFLVFIGAFALLLFSYDPTDASFNTASTGTVNNLLGYFGSCIADIFMQTFGWVSWLFVLFLLASFFFKAKHKQRSFVLIKRLYQK